MFAKISATLGWIKVVRLYHRGRYTEFLNSLKNYENKYELEPYESTLKAYALLATENFDDAEAIFSSVCRSVVNDESDKGRYLYHIAGGMIHKLNGRDGQAEIEFREARLLSSGSLYMTMLPTSTN